MLQATSFTFNGKTCEDMGVTIVKTSNGLFKDNFLPTRKIIEKTVSDRSKPYFQRVVDEPLSFSLTLLIENWEQENSLRRIASWLYTTEYEELWFNTNPNNIYYAMVEGGSDLMHNGVFQGYINIKFRTNSPHSYSTVKNKHNILDVNGSRTELFYNEGDKTIRPYMVITKTVSNGDLSITNNRSGEIFKLNDIRNGEIVTVDCANYFMTSSHEQYKRYLYDNHNDIWLDWQPDKHNEVTSFTFTGNFNIDFTFQYTYLVEANVMRPN